MNDLFPGLNRRLVNHYLAEFGVRGVVAIARDAAGPTEIVCSSDAHLRRARGCHAVAFWTLAGQAEPLARGVCVMLRDEGRHRTAVGWSITAAEGGDAIRERARALKIPITEHSVMVARTAAALARIEATIAEMQASGRLSDFNRAFRAGRLEGSTEPVSYRRLIHGLRQSLISEIAHKALRSNGFLPSR